MLTIETVGHCALIPMYLENSGHLGRDAKDHMKKFNLHAQISSVF